jgi:DivIVA domain-containing protein
MPLTPDEVAGKKFSAVYGRGYARTEVDAFLAEVASDYRAAIEKIALAAEEASNPQIIGEEVAAILQKSRESAKMIMDKARAEAGKLRNAAIVEKREAEKEAKRIKAEAMGRLDSAKAEERKLRSGAQQKVEREMRNKVDAAEKQGREVVESAKRAAAALVAHAQKRTELQQQIDEQLREKVAGVDHLVRQLRALLDGQTKVDLRDAAKADDADDEIVLALEPETDAREMPTPVGGGDATDGEPSFEGGGRN